MGTSAGIGSLGTQASLLDTKEDSLMQGLARNKGPSDDAKITKGSQQFEAILVGTWLKEAEQSFGSAPGGDADQDAGGEQMMSLGIQTLSSSLAASGGLGIGRMIAKAMHAAADKQAAEDTTGTKEVGRNSAV
ncbi:MAG: hypothetical protein WB439_07600 [Acidobacteriaceae bacterium]